MVAARKAVDPAMWITVCACAETANVSASELARRVLYAFTCLCFSVLTQGSGGHSVPSLVEITAPVVGTNIIKAIMGRKRFSVTFLLQLVPFSSRLINILLTNTECDSVSRSYGTGGLLLIRWEQC